MMIIQIMEEEYQSETLNETDYTLSVQALQIFEASFRMHIPAGYAGNDILLVV